MAENATNLRRLIGGALSFLALAGLIALFFAFRRGAVGLPTARLSVSVRKLPYYAFCSFYRMLAAYVLALGFSILYGLIAARGRLWERVMIPAIDIAQSVPVIGFFPAAVYFFVSISSGGRLGVELAAIFLIFTSQAWNMTLGVFESAKTIPVESIEALESFGVSGWLKFKRLLMPACVPKLVYNSILSWVAGWYFLIACEIITVGPNRYRLPGLGSYLMEAADKGRSGEIVAGLLALLAIIIAMDFLIWQPLSVWSEKFRYEFAATSPQMKVLLSSGAFGRTFVRTARLVWAPFEIIIAIVAAATPTIRLADYPGLKRALRILAWAVLIGVAGFIFFAIIDGIIALIHALARPWPEQARLIPAATGASIVRMIIAYALSLLWIMPCALYASENPRFGRKLASVAEIIGSVPATALFPLIVLFVIEVTGGMNLASILLIITGMQWYLLFNLLAGVNQIPADLKEAAHSFGLGRYHTWRKLVLPSITPSLITGSITAWGGGWNALILSEYFVYHDQTYSVLGLGALLDAATYQTGDGTMILLSLLSMILVVIVLNRLLWRRLYNFATERYRLDY